MAERIGVVLFSGTADRLLAAAELVSGAAAAGERADVLLMQWGLRAFRRDEVALPPPCDPAYAEQCDALERRLADRTGGAQDGDAAAHPASPSAAVPTAATTATGTSPSSRSRMPP